MGPRRIHEDGGSPKHVALDNVTVTSLYSNSSPMPTLPRMASEVCPRLAARDCISQETLCCLYSYAVVALMQGMRAKPPEQGLSPRSRPPVLRSRLKHPPGHTASFLNTELQRHSLRWMFPETVLWITNGAQNIGICCMSFFFFLIGQVAEVYEDKDAEASGGQAEGSELFRFCDFKASDL